MIWVGRVTPAYSCSSVWNPFCSVVTICNQPGPATGTQKPASYDMLFPATPATQSEDDLGVFRPALGGAEDLYTRLAATSISASKVTLNTKPSEMQFFVFGLQLPTQILLCTPVASHPGYCHNKLPKRLVLACSHRLEIALAASYCYLYKNKIFLHTWGLCIVL